MQEQKRIVVISEDLTEPWDEGIKKFTFSVAQALAKEHDVLMINVDRSGVGRASGAGGVGDVRSAPGSGSVAAVRVRGARTFASRDLFRSVRGHEPDAILYVPSPSNTLSSHVRAAVLRRFVPRAAIGMVALIPRQHARFLRAFLGRTAPDIVWVPSYRSLLTLSRLSLRGDVLPVGVDVERFHPPREGEKKRLREEHGIDPEAYVYLHVGHLRPKRNVAVLSALAGASGTETIVIGSTSTPEDTALHASLEASGARVIRRWVEVEVYYRMADCYVFPVEDSEGCIEMPLSVLEALASGVPVVSTPFGGLPDFFAPGEDFRYARGEDELHRAAEAMRAEGPVTVRDMSSFTWDGIARRIAETLII